MVWKQTLEKKLKIAHCYSIVAKDEIAVGDDIVVEGKFRFHSDWPQAVDDPDVILRKS